MKINWQIKKLSEVCDIINGSTPLRNKKDFWYNGTINWFTIEDIRNQGRRIKKTKQKISEIALNETSLRILPPKSILLCCTASIGEYAINEIPLTTNQQFNGLVIKNQKILDPFFLYYFSATLKDQLFKLSGKTTIDFIPISRLREIEISFPPLSEQQRIVQILDDVFEEAAKAKENAEKNIQNARELFESYLQNIFANPNGGWEAKKLGTICEIKPPKKKTQEKLKSDDLVSFVPMEDLLTRSKDFVTDKERKLEEVYGSYTYFADEDVLLAKITPCFENGKIGVARNLKNGIGFGSSEYIVFRTKGEIIPDYLFYFLSRDQFRKEGKKEMAGAVGHKRVSKDFIENYRLPFPKSIAEQKAIVAKLDTLSKETKKLENIYKQKLTNLEEFKKSILKKAFSGALSK